MSQESNEIFAFENGIMYNGAFVPYSTMYPSIIKTYNLSPQIIIQNYMGSSYSTEEDKFINDDSNELSKVD